MAYYFNKSVDPTEAQNAVVQSFTSGGLYKGSLEVWRNGESGFCELGARAHKDKGELNRALMMSAVRLAYDVSDVAPDYISTIMDAARTAAAHAEVSPTIVRVYFKNASEDRHIVWLLFDHDHQGTAWQQEGHNRDIVV
ncbi:hypothetical protein KX729_09225 [Rhizobium sp. XQZ8]|uniref:hypothetical protein n=1 Tax=Rhizobium populisoli TaxID=2859785 RepID=UPI001CA4D1EA|nr:hypothetical protein [Rhizobium populisoli]MBW6421620.1 hypothetical protein [Rhizobium populisoli]